jgi:hypothetical protein
MSDIDQAEQAEHAAQFRNAGRHLMDAAHKLTKAGRLDALDVASLYFSTGVMVMLTTMGRPGVASYLRELADKIEAGREVQALNS